MVYVLLESFSQLQCGLTGDEIWIAEYDLECNREDELSLTKGELIYVFEKSESGWWKGRCDDERAGWLPASYLRPPTSQEVQDKKKVEHLCFCYVCIIIFCIHCVNKLKPCLFICLFCYFM